MRVHNLQDVNLDIPLGKLVVVTGVSGSGKSSLAFDTLYAEGQRRYVESFSNYARRFLDRFEKPDADRIEPIPPAVAVRQRSGVRSRRATVGTATEIYDHLRLLFARAGSIVCPNCSRPVERHTPAMAQTALAGLQPRTRFMICFPLADAGQNRADERALGAEDLAKAGFSRLIVGGRTLNLSEAAPHLSPSSDTLVVVDRLTAGAISADRVADSLELAFRHGNGACVVLVTAAPASPGSPKMDRRTVDGAEYEVLSFSTRLICGGCRREFADPEPALFNFNSPLGACPDCRGTGEVAVDEAAGSSLQVCSTCRGTRLRPEAEAVRVIGRSIVELVRMTADELLAFLRAGRTEGTVGDRHISNQILQQAVSRLEYLCEVGLGYLTLDRPARTLSGGEAQRVRLTSAFGSKFVNLLYVLDEPTCGLHPCDTERLLVAIRRLRDAGNTLVVVEHDSSLIREADQAIDIGPGAGREGGRVIFQGPPAELAGQQSVTAEFLSGRRTVSSPNAAARRLPTGWLKLTGVEHHNLHNVSVDFPLGVLCVVTGVSGSGKSSLVEDTLYPALVSCLNARAVPGSEATRAPKDEVRRPSPLAVSPNDGSFRSLTGIDQIDSVLKIDQGPIGRSARANPASFLGLFGEIRSLFATTAEAKVHNFSARHFSFNSAGGGRCEMCRGAGSIAIDMQFLPDVVTTCPDCHGTRFRREILEARYRGLSIAEVLALTVRDAFTFFRGRTRLQRKLKVLKDVGLDYITLGQPANTLSGGESQRLKLASFLSRASRARTLFVVDEPTTGLHPADIARLIDCLGQLLAAGHSVIVIEHNLDFIRSADSVIDLGPGAGAAGGRIIATGTPEEVSHVPDSVTGRFLAK